VVTWLLPTCAAAFWLGLFTGEDLAVPVGGVLLLIALLGWCVAGLSGVRRWPLSTRLLQASGLGRGRREPIGSRQRVLLAAEFTLDRPEPSVRAEGTGRRLATIVLGFVVAGAGWAGLHLQARALGPLEGRYVAFRGTAASDLRTYEWGWALEARVESVELDGRSWPVDLRAWVSGNGDSSKAEAGEHLRGEGRLESLGTGGFAEYLTVRGVEAGIRTSALEVEEGSESPPLRAANAVRGGLREGLGRALSDRPAGLLLGLAIGDTAQLDAEVEEDFRASGLGHLLAVSGSNVAIFLAPLLALATRFRARPGARAILGVAAVLFFALLTRWEPSVLRASAMAAIALCGLASGRPRSTGPALGAAVLLLLVADPRLAWSVGFQLSVAATAGISALAGPIAARLVALPKPLALAVAATVAAQAAVTPVLLLVFGVVPTVTLVANVLAFPAVAPALLFGICSAALSLAWAPLGVPLGRLAALPLDYLIGVADRTARFPLPSLAADGPLVPLALTALVVLGAWRLRRGRRPVGVIAAMAVVTAVAWSVPLSGSARTMTATFLDVGQGDAALVRSPGGATILIDAGPDEQQVAADLARLGVRKIDLAVATHAHADHVAGFPAVLARFPVSLLLDPGCGGDSPFYARFLDSVADEGVRVEHPRGGDHFTVGDVSVDVLGPDECFPADEPNNNSIVLLVSLGGDSILFPGDAEVPVQQEMLEDHDPIEADVLKVPHHGGDTSDPLFLEATHANVAIVSTGPNTYGHPNPGVLEVLRDAGMVIYRTDIGGEVSLRFSASGDVVVGSAPG
jgi:competence protein ComEC